MSRMPGQMLQELALGQHLAASSQFHADQATTIERRCPQPKRRNCIFAFSGLSLAHCSRKDRETRQTANYQTYRVSAQSSHASAIAPGQSGEEVRDKGRKS